MGYKAKYGTKKQPKEKPAKAHKTRISGKKKTKSLLITAIVLSVCVAGCGVWYYLGHRNNDPVYVYPFQFVGMTEYWGDSQESYGPVSTDKIQTIFLTDTQIVTEVCVKEGDPVKKGDLLMTFDTTLDDLALERKRLEVEKLKLELADAKEQLNELNDMTPMEPPDLTPPTLPDTEPAPGEVQAVPQIFGDPVHNGKTQANPLVYWVGGDTWLSNNVLRSLLLRAAQEQGGTAVEIPEFPELLDPEETVPETTEETIPETTEEIVPETTWETIPENTEEIVPETTMAAVPEPPEETDPPEESVPETTRETEPAVVATVPTESAAVPTQAPTEAEEYLNTEAQDALASDEGLDIPSSASALDLPGEENQEKPSNVVGAPIDHYFFILKSTQGNLKNGVPIAWQGIEVQVVPYGFSIRLFDASGVPDYTLTPEEGDGTLSDLPGLDFGSGMTGAQLAQMRAEQQKKIKDLDFQIKMAEADYKIMQTEISDGNVYADIDGSVVSVLPEEDARKNEQPLIKVSGGGGFYIQGSVNELARESLEVGQEVDVTDYDTGGFYKGKIVSIGEFPGGMDFWNGMSNPNSSSYPFQVFVDGSADLRDGYYVMMNFSSGSSQKGIYLENAFVRTEHGRSYVLVKGQNGRLEQRFVTTGKSLWGSYTEVFGEITADDMIAFPYGKNVKVGAVTVDGDMSDLYG